jgi:hypothetical protein
MLEGGCVGFREAIEAEALDLLADLVDESRRIAFSFIISRMLRRWLHIAAA